MRNLITFLFCFFIIVAFSTCKKIKTNPPEASTLDTLIQLPVSVLYVPVQYRVSDFEKIINEKIQGKFIDKWMNLNDKGDSLYLAISRMRRITIQRRDRTLFIVVPLKVSGKVRAKFAGIKIKNEAPVEAEINIHLSTTLKMDSKWNLLSDTHLDKIDWIKEPKLKVGFLNINLRGPIEKMLEKKEESVTAKADATLKTALNTRKVVSDIWRDIQLAHRINKQGVQVWLRPYGVDLKGRLEETEQDLISLQFQLKTLTHIYFEGDSIPPPNTVLPDFARIDETKDSLIVYVHSLLRFDMVNDFLEKELDGKPISAKGFTTTIQHVRFYGTQTGIAVALQVKGDIDGTLYVKGTPSYDSLSNTIALKDFEFDISSESALINSADWLLHSKVLELISDKLKVNLTPLAVQLPKIIFNAIEKGKTGEKIDLNVDTLVLHPLVILPTRNNLQLLVMATGKASVTLNEKLFNKNDKKVSVR
jgi:hypothetical protein